MKNGLQSIVVLLIAGAGCEAELESDPLDTGVASAVEDVAEPESLHRATVKDGVVFVHGNAGSNSDWNNTRNVLQADGYSQFFYASWGGSNPATNSHTTTNIRRVRDAIDECASVSPTGRCDVLTHSMGATLAAKSIVDYDQQNKVASFIGIAGAFSGLESCYFYTYNPTCSSSRGLYQYGSFVANLESDIENEGLGTRVYSIKSYYDQVVCLNAWLYYQPYYACDAGDPSHTSNVPDQDASYTYNGLGHFGLQSSTTSRQLTLANATP